MDVDTPENAASTGGTLFRGVRFWIAQRCPTRSTFVEQVKRNGGEVVTLEKNANIKIADHVRKDNPPDTFSYTWIEACIREGQLVDQANHRAGPPLGSIRPVGALKPAKTSRHPFSTEDDLFLHNWVTDHERRGGKVAGNEIYKQLEAVNDRHPWQSWRDRYLKYVQLNPPVPNAQAPPPDLALDNFGIDRTSTSPAKLLQHPRQEEPRYQNINAPAPFITIVTQDTVQAEDHGPIFTKAETDILLAAAPFIENNYAGRRDEAWDEFAVLHPEHTAAEWMHYYETVIQPTYRQGQTADKIKHRNEKKLKHEQQQAALDKGTSKASPETRKTDDTAAVFRGHGGLGLKEPVAQSASMELTLSPVVRPKTPVWQKYPGSILSSPRTPHADPGYSGPIVIIPSPFPESKLRPLLSKQGIDHVELPRSSEQGVAQAKTLLDARNSVSISPERAQSQERQDARPKRQRNTDSDCSVISSVLSAPVTKRRRQQSPLFEPGPVVGSRETPSSPSAAPITGRSPVRTKPLVEVVDIVDTESESQSSEGYQTEFQEDKEDDGNGSLSPVLVNNPPSNQRTASLVREKHHGESKLNERFPSEDDKFGIYEDGKFANAEKEQENVIPDGYDRKAKEHVQSNDTLQAFSTNPIDFKLLTPEISGLDVADTGSENEEDEDIYPHRFPSEDLDGEAVHDFRSQTLHHVSRGEELGGSAEFDELDESDESVLPVELVESDESAESNELDESPLGTDHEVINKPALLNGNLHTDDTEMVLPPDDSDEEEDEVEAISEERANHAISTPNTQAILNAETQDLDLTMLSPPNLDDADDNEDYDEDEEHPIDDMPSSPPPIPSTPSERSITITRYRNRVVTSSGGGAEKRLNLREAQFKDVAVQNTHDPNQALENFVKRFTMLGYGEEDVYWALYRTSMEVELARQVLEVEAEGGKIDAGVKGVWSIEEDEVLMGGDAKAMARLEARHGKRAYARRLTMLQEMS